MWRIPTALRFLLGRRPLHSNRLPRPPPHRSNFFPLSVVTAATASASALAFLTVYSHQHPVHADPAPPAPSPPESPPPPVPSPKRSSAPLSRYCVADAVDKVLPAVVNIRRVVQRSPYRMLLAVDANPVEVSGGSGFFISSDGLLVTNAHVVTSGDPSLDDDSTLHVTTAHGDHYIGRLVACDPLSDIALVKISVDAPVPVAVLGDSDSVRPGEFVVAVGSPLTLSNSVSFGIVSMIQRDLTDSQPITHTPRGLTYLQLDVAINQGSSGGPCVTLDGDVIGIASMKIAGGVEGIAFAIPIRYATRVIEDLCEHGRVRRPYVGLTLISVTPALFEHIRQDTSYRPPRWLETEIRHTNSAKSIGLMVHHVNKDSPAHAAGLKAGDVVVAVNDNPTTTTSEFLAALSFHVEQDCSVTVRRAQSGRVDHITIRPQALPPDADVG